MVVCVRESLQLSGTLAVSVGHFMWGSMSTVLMVYITFFRYFLTDVSRAESKHEQNK